MAARESFRNRITSKILALKAINHNTFIKKIIWDVFLVNDLCKDIFKAEYIFLLNSYVLLEEINFLVKS